MFKNESRHAYQMFPSVHKLMTRGFLLFGAFSVFLAGLIFLFPAIIGFFVATFLLATGLIALVAGYRFWKMHDIKSYNVKPFYSEPEFLKIHWHEPTHYHFQTIHLTRW